MGYYSKIVDLPVEEIKKEHILPLFKVIREENDREKRVEVIKKTIDALDILYEDKDESYSPYQRLCFDMAVCLIMGCESRMSKQDRCVIYADSVRWLERLDGVIEAKNRKKMVGCTEKVG